MANKADEVKDRAKEDALRRGIAFDSMVRTDGWKLVQEYFEGKIQSFTNRILIEKEKNIEEFEAERQQLIGLRGLLLGVNGEIESIKENDAEEGTESTG